MSRTDYWQKFEENADYHIYNRGINGVNLFYKDGNYNFFLRKWKKLIHPFFETIAYCLMPNHFHFLVKVKPLTDDKKEEIKMINTSKSQKVLAGEVSYNDFLEDQFKRLFSSYALAINKQESRTGSLFQKRFKRISIASEYKLYHLLAYIHHNPIHHRFTSHFGDWKYSSYSSYLSDQPTLVVRENVLLWFDDQVEKAKVTFVKYHEEFRLDNQMEYIEETL